MTMNPFDAAGLGRILSTDWLDFLRGPLLAIRCWPAIGVDDLGAVFLPQRKPNAAGGANITNATKTPPASTPRSPKPAACRRPRAIRTSPAALA